MALSAQKLWISASRTTLFARSEKSVTGRRTVAE